MNIVNALSAEGLIFDRFLGSTYALPYPDFESIRIQPNDLAIASVINLALEKLYKNFLYLYKSSRIASNVIPISSTAVAGVSTGSTNFRWFLSNEGLSASQFIPLSSASLYNQDNITTIAAIQNTENSNFYITASTGDDLVIYKTDDRLLNNTLDYNTSINVVLSTKQTFPGSNINWQQINSFALGNNYSFYVLDSIGNRLVKYDAGGLYTSDIVLRDKILFINSIGGEGSFSDNTFFNRPSAIDIYNTDVYVLDSGNSCVKRYDQDLNWISTFRLFRDFAVVNPVHLTHDYYGNRYILTDNDILYKYDVNFQNRSTIQLDPLTASDEYYKKVVFSAFDPNIFYLVTSQNVYKRLVDQPSDEIGKYLFHLYNFNTEETIADFFSLAGNDGDNNIIFSNSNGAGKFSIWYDNINLFNVLATGEFDIYDLNDIAIQNNEYLQNWVINKSLAKLLINHMRLRDLMTGKFIATYNEYKDIVLSNTRYFLPDEIASINFEQSVDNFIGMNEPVHNNIVNRCLQQIYQIQVNIFNALSTDFQLGAGPDETILIN